MHARSVCVCVFLSLLILCCVCSLLVCCRCCCTFWLSHDNTHGPRSARAVAGSHFCCRCVCSCMCAYPLLGVSFLAVRYFFLDRCRPAFRFRRLLYASASLPSLSSHPFHVAVSVGFRCWLVWRSWQRCSGVCHIGLCTALGTFWLRLRAIC